LAFWLLAFWAHALETLADASIVNPIAIVDRNMTATPVHLFVQGVDVGQTANSGCAVSDCIHGEESGLD
jgi:hypothetical protein